MIGIGLYLTVVAALAIGIGAIIRNVAGAIGAFVGILLVLPVIASALPPTWGNRIDKLLPSNAGQALMSFGSDNTTLSPWRGFIVFCVYAAVTIGVAARCCADETPEQRTADGARRPQPSSTQVAVATPCNTTSFRVTLTCSELSDVPLVRA